MTPQSAKKFPHPKKNITAQRISQKSFTTCKYIMNLAYF